MFVWFVSLSIHMKFSLVQSQCLMMSNYVPNSPMLGWLHLFWQHCTELDEGEKNYKVYPMCLPITSTHEIVFLKPQMVISR
jgi:hypothetical protein